MRLFLLPISTRHTLLYCERVSKAAADQQTIVDKISNKASTTWANWERAEPASFWRGGWQNMLTTQGNKILRRIPYQEWGLKSVPPLNKKREQAALEGTTKVEVLFPGRYLPGAKVKSLIERLATERQSLHKKNLTWCLIGMPVSAPFALVPVIPNIPFFYLAFRAYSHWKALAGSKHLLFWLKHSLLREKPTPELDELYTAGLMYSSRQLSRDSPSPTADKIESVSTLIQDQTNGGTEDVMMLQRWNGKLIAERFDLPEMEIEIERAVEQVENDIKSQQELMEEKREIEKATGNYSSPRDTATEKDNEATK